MNALLRLLLVLMLATAGRPSIASDSLTCTGKFPNPITDICWSCILPISIGSATIANFDGQEDIAHPSSPVCSCGVNPTIGL
jgi:conjugal transfer pilus assembly protein TraU